MRNHSIRRCALFALVVLAVTFTGEAGTQQVNPALQGRLVQRSDGGLYVVKDGLKYAIQLADVGDDDINALPDGPVVNRVDQLFAQPAAAAVSPQAAPVPVADPALPTPGTLLYQAEWSTGSNGWALPSDWQVVGGLLTNLATYSGPSIIAAPYEPVSPDYAVEAEMQATKYVPPLPGAPPSNGFGLVSRGDEVYQYQGGVLDAGRNAGILSQPPAFPGSGTLVLRATRAFNVGTGWHTYRLEAKGDTLRLLVQGGRKGAGTRSMAG